MYAKSKRNKIDLIINHLKEEKVNLIFDLDAYYMTSLSLTVI